MTAAQGAELGGRPELAVACSAAASVVASYARQAMDACSDRNIRIRNMINPERVLAVEVGQALDVLWLDGHTHWEGGQRIRVGRTAVRDLRARMAGLIIASCWGASPQFLLQVQLAVTRPVALLASRDTVAYRDALPLMTAVVAHLEELAGGPRTAQQVLRAFQGALRQLKQDEPGAWNSWEATIVHPAKAHPAGLLVAM